MSFQKCVLILCGLSFSAMVHSHEPGVLANDLVHGLVHPLVGWDHIAVMLGIGICSAIPGNRSLAVLPGIFLGGMGAGAILAIWGLRLPAIEAIVAGSLIVTGGLIAFDVHIRARMTVFAVTLIALVHGYVHIIETGPTTDLSGYAAGFLLASSLLNLLGVALGQLSRLPAGKRCLRLGGGGIAIAGAGLLSAVV